MLEFYETLSFKPIPHGGIFLVQDCSSMESIISTLDNFTNLYFIQNCFGSSVGMLK